MAGSISTRTGDTGTGQLMFGGRVSKASARLEAVGTIDELGSALGMCRVEAADDPLAPRIEQIQRDLFIVGAELGTSPSQRRNLTREITQQHVEDLDAQVAELEAIPGMLEGWALPGATRLGATLDVARTVCRRAERRLVAVYELDGVVNTALIPYINRLSDVLWLYARWYEHRLGLSGAL